MYNLRQRDILKWKFWIFGCWFSVFTFDFEQVFTLGVPSSTWAQGVNWAYIERLEGVCTCAYQKVNIRASYLRSTDVLCPFGCREVERINITKNIIKGDNTENYSGFSPTVLQSLLDSLSHNLKDLVNWQE